MEESEMREKKRDSAEKLDTELETREERQKESKKGREKRGTDSLRGSLTTSLPGLSPQGFSPLRAPPHTPHPKPGTPDQGSLNEPWAASGMVRET